MAIVTAKNLSFTYAVGNKKALNDVSFQIEQGEIVLLMGRCGSGKTTLARLMKKELAQGGQITGNLEVATNGVGFVFQNADDAMVCDTVSRELSFGLNAKGCSYEETRLRVAEIAAYFNLSSVLDDEIESLSGGMKQIVALAAAMVDSPELLILDEPCAALDPLAKEGFLSLLLKVNKELGVSVIMATHAPSDFYANADKVIVLNNGKVQYDDTPKAVAEMMKADNDDILGALPVCTRLLEGEPLNIATARNMDFDFKEKEQTPLSLPKPTVEVKNALFAYSKCGRDVLCGLSFNAYPGMINAIIGCNGSGKTTLLSCIAGVMKPYRGRISCKGSTSMMSQNVKYLFTADKVGDEISEDTAEYLGISDVTDSHPYDISTGQAHLLALGMVIETKADIIILDEPTQGLDATAKGKLRQVLNSLLQQGKTVIMATHDLNFAGDTAGQISFVSSGAVCHSGDRRSVFSNLDYYTTDFRRLVRGKLPTAVSTEDLM